MENKNEKVQVSFLPTNINNQSIDIVKYVTKCTSMEAAKALCLKNNDVKDAIAFIETSQQNHQNA